MKTKKLRKRFKTINFKEDYTFSLDSAKQKYSGTWKVIENKVFLSFSEKELTHLYKNTDPNNAVNAYLTETETIQLNDRVGMVQSNILIFK
jgi:hypothetical protein